MGTSGLTRRLLATGALGVGIGIAPLLATAVAAAPAATHVAAPSCTVTQSNGSASLNCPPSTSGASTDGAPSEQAITEKNAQRGMGGGGLLGGIF
jgi:hypothetical protein